ncbi:hypothetical protein Prum_029650 [Phytohabitans rumicis]|uniref:Lipoprotein n=2 Tax=Phytohabitans rumicis TaxID=1076125 RepID=A0A6V8KW58_9ACTN|nr:hypothetical protein Prum_029650 [Phytohabitans rumicis]
MKRRVALVCVVVAGMAGCGESGAETAASWQEPGSYSYVLASQCGERLLLGRFRITVEQGKVTKAEGLDGSARRALEGKSDSPPTLRQLLDEWESARRDGAEVADLSTDPGDGHPTKIMIDPVKNAMDDEACYTITEFAVV